MNKFSRLFLSLIIMSGFALAQNPGTAAQAPATQNAPAKKKIKKKKKKSVPATEQPGVLNNGQTSTSQGTGQPPADPAMPPPNSPENRAPQATPEPTPPATPPQ